MPTFTTKTTIRHANGDKTLMAETVTETPEELPVAIAEAIPEEKAAPTEATPEEKAAPEAAPAAEAPVSAPVEPETEPEVVHAVAEEVVKVAHEGEIGKRLKKAAARVGALTVSLIWDNVDDLDLHAQTPMAQGETGHIFWNNKKGGCGGHLDVDMNASTKNMISAPIENIFWDKPPPGQYRIWVENNEQRVDGATPFTVRLTKDGKAEEVSFDDAEEFEEYVCFEFEVGS